MKHVRLLVVRVIVGRSVLNLFMISSQQTGTVKEFLAMMGEVVSGLDSDESSGGTRAGRARVTTLACVSSTLALALDGV